MRAPGQPLEISIDITKSEGMVAMTVADNGDGIPESVIPHLFEPYYTTKSASGTGIGLYLSRMIVENSLHGTIEWGNQEGSGARFVVRFPEVLPKEN